MVLEKYVSMFDLLNIETKIALLARLSDNLNQSFRKTKRDKKELFESLAGSWADVDDSIVEDIYNSRTYSERKNK